MEFLIECFHTVVHYQITSAMHENSIDLFFNRFVILLPFLFVKNLNRKARIFLVNFFLKYFFFHICILNEFLVLLWIISDFSVFDNVMAIIHLKLPRLWHMMHDVCGPLSVVTSAAETKTKWQKQKKVKVERWKQSI